MRHAISLSALAVFLATTPALAQSQTDPVQTNPAPTDLAPAESIEGDADSNFSRDIPDGLKSTLTEREINVFQARLNAAETPQERNRIRQEIQRTNQARHLSDVQNKETKTMQDEDAEPKGFFASMRDDFRDMMNDDDDDQNDAEDNDADDADDDRADKVSANRDRDNNNNDKSGGNGDRGSDRGGDRNGNNKNK